MMEYVWDGLYCLSNLSDGKVKLNFFTWMNYQMPG
jgi:hypothetical protein